MNQKGSTCERLPSDSTPEEAAAPSSSAEVSTAPSPDRVASGTIETTPDRASDTTERSPRWSRRTAGELARRTLVAVATSVAATSLVVRTTIADPPTPSSAHLALRKAPPEDDEDVGGGLEPVTDDRMGDARTVAEAGLPAPMELETLGTLFNLHTGEVMPLSSDEPTQERFSRTLSDRSTGSSIALDPRLLELLRAIARRNPMTRIELVSGYRSPKLNEMLRKKGHNVASHSQHSLGHACDFRIAGLTPAQMKKEVLALGWQGGIGRYDKRSDWFVHADVGPKRAWYEGR